MIFLVGVGGGLSMKIKEGGVMDINKEREAFESWFESRYDAHFMQFALDLDMYADKHTQTCWEAWQAAKAQAAPDGFVLASKEPSADLVNHGHQVFLGHFNEGGQTGGRSLYFAYKAMIEAQELQ